MLRIQLELLLRRERERLRQYLAATEQLLDQLRRVPAVEAGELQVRKVPLELQHEVAHRNKTDRVRVAHLAAGLVVAPRVADRHDLAQAVHHNQPVDAGPHQVALAVHFDLRLLAAEAVRYRLPLALAPYHHALDRPFDRFGPRQRQREDVARLAGVAAQRPVLVVAVCPLQLDAGVRPRHQSPVDLHFVRYRNDPILERLATLRHVERRPHFVGVRAVEAGVRVRRLALDASLESFRVRSPLVLEVLNLHALSHFVGRTQRTVHRRVHVVAALAHATAIGCELSTRPRETLHDQVTVLRFRVREQHELSLRAVGTSRVVAHLVEQLMRADVVGRTLDRPARLVDDRQQDVAAFESDFGERQAPRADVARQQDDLLLDVADAVVAQVDAPLLEPVAAGIWINRGPHRQLHAVEKDLLGLRLVHERDVEDVDVARQPVAESEEQARRHEQQQSVHRVQHHDLRDEVFTRSHSPDQ